MILVGDYSYMHVESSMTYPEEFSRAGAVSHNCGGDPHEIKPTCLESKDLSFMEERRAGYFYGIPSSVPGYQNRDGDIRGGVWGKGTRELLR